MDQAPHRRGRRPLHELPGACGLRLAALMAEHVVIIGPLVPLEQRRELAPLELGGLRVVLVEVAIHQALADGARPLIPLAQPRQSAGAAVPGEEAPAVPTRRLKVVLPVAATGLSAERPLVLSCASRASARGLAPGASSYNSAGAVKALEGRLDVCRHRFVMHQTSIARRSVEFRRHAARLAARGSTARLSVPEADPVPARSGGGRGPAVEARPGPRKARPVTASRSGTSYGTSRARRRAVHASSASPATGVGSRAAASSAALGSPPRSCAGSES